MSGQWKNHPKLRGRLNQEHPDDIRVVVHDGGPRLSRVAPEVVWVRITDGEGDLFSGRVLNQPDQLKSISAGSSIRFKVPASSEFPLMVTEEYLAERPDWLIQPCNRCGLTELFDAPSDLIRVVFPDGPEKIEPEMFTAICGWCGGVQVVQRTGAEGAADQTSKQWWQFWR